MGYTLPIGESCVLQHPWRITKMATTLDKSKVGKRPNESYSPIVTTINGKIVLVGGCWKWGPRFAKQDAEPQVQKTA